MIQLYTHTYSFFRFFKIYTPLYIKGKTVFIPILKKGNDKDCSNYYTIAFISLASKVMLKILQVRLQQCMNQEVPVFKLDLEKAEEPEIKLLTSTDSYRKQDNSRKMSTSSSMTALKPFTVWITINCGRFFKRWKYQTTLPASQELVCRSRNNS